MNGLHIFRRDLRLNDNTSLIELLKKTDRVYLVFIFTKQQIIKNKLRNDTCVNFLIESLYDLNLQTENKLNIVYDFNFENETDLISHLVKDYNIKYISFAEDYTLYSKIRNNKIKQIEGIECITVEDSMLVPVKNNIRTSTGKVYEKFTPYYNNVKTINIDLPIHFNKNNIKNIPTFEDLKKEDLKKEHNIINIRNSNNISEFKAAIIDTFNKEFAANNLSEFAPHACDIIGGRKNAKAILKNYKKYENYNVSRDYPAIHGTTRLSAYNKFGCVSIREVYYTFYNLKNYEPITRELFWRDFYYYVAYNSPHVLKPLSEKNIEAQVRNYNKKTTTWDNDNDLYLKWCEGKTGYPIVDAGMRQLNTIGWMHNRLRMIVANFLVKLLNIDWQLGEIYFAKNLVDYDPCQNNGGWQWSTPFGVDSMPDFRIFNPETQIQKYDKNCEYIKKWVTELEKYSPKDIIKGDIEYYKKIVDYKVAREKYLNK